MSDLLTFEEFAAHMAQLAPYEDAPVLAVATSGGGDSMALLRLCHDWAQAHGGRAIALTVDHQLRKESTMEASQVKDWCASLGIEHHTLVWHGEKPTTGIQAAARAKRYALLEDWCYGAGVLHLLTAHHQDDQAETVLLRFMKGSGLVGLGGMQPATYRSHLRLLRPLLNVPKAQLLATCEAYKQPFIHDPSNDNPQFTRVRLRHFMAGFADETSAAQMLQSQHHGQMLQDWLEGMVQWGLAETVRYHPDHLLWQYQAWRHWPQPVRLHGLRTIIHAWQHTQKAVKFARLYRLADALWLPAAGLPKAVTLGGLIFQPTDGDYLRISHEDTRIHQTTHDPKP